MLKAMSRILLPYCLLLGIATSALNATESGALMDDPYAIPFVIAADTIPDIEERYGDFVTEGADNPFDLEDPSIIEKNIDYDPASGNYIITEQIGDLDFRPPTFLTFDEYFDLRQKQEERAYFNRLAGIASGEGSSSLDPLAKIDVENNLLDRLFGGTTVDIRPQGNIDLTFGVDFSRVDNPILTERQRLQGGFDFDMNINMNVTGKIGEKLNLTTNYNTNATFNFDNQIKLDYNSDNFDEDAIIKKIEAGNVSLPLRGNLIQGAQSLFGLKSSSLATCASPRSLPSKNPSRKISRWKVVRRSSSSKCGPTNTMKTDTSCLASTTAITSNGPCATFPRSIPCSRSRNWKFGSPTTAMK